MSSSLPERNKIVIKKYPNRRLYNTTVSSYITLEELSDLIKKDYDVVVIDSKTGEDLTRITLTQIILEHESKGYNLLPLDFLKQIIKFYDHDLSSVFNSYLVSSLEYFLMNQENIQKFIGSLSGGMIPFSNNWTKVWEDFTKQNSDFMQMMMKGMSTFQPPKSDDDKK
jgi:polyhydroxyalkanoate synthesis repressor PhaR